MFLTFCALAAALYSQFELQAVETTCVDSYSWICVFLDESAHQAVADDAASVAAVATESAEAPESFEGAEVTSVTVEPEPAANVAAVLEADLEPATVIAEEPNVAAAPAMIPEEPTTNAIETEIDGLPAELLGAWPTLSPNTRESILMLIEADLMTQE